MWVQASERLGTFAQFHVAPKSRQTHPDGAGRIPAAGALLNMGEKMKSTKEKNWTYKDCIRAAKRETNKLFREKKLEDFDVQSKFINTKPGKKPRGRFTLILKFVDK